MIGWSANGSFSDTEKWLRRMIEGNIFDSLKHFGDEGVRALQQATPKDSGETAAAWSYEIVKEKDSWSIIWTNSHDANGTPVAVLLQLGHGTGTGGYVRGRDYINPALRPIFDRISKAAWKVVTAA